MVGGKFETSPVRQAPSAEEKWDVVQQVGRSQTFQKSPRLREFFLYVADCTLNNRLDDVREQQIAQNVFHRKPDYNPGQDNIVRVEARLLRKRLEAYFSSEGQGSSMLIAMPKGSYALSFEHREAEHYELIAGEEKPPAPAAGMSADSPARKLSIADEHPDAAISSALLSGTSYSKASRLTSPFWVLLIAVVALGAAAGGFLLGRQSINPPRPAVPLLPLAAIIDPDRDVDLVTSDTSLVILQDLAGRNLGLDDYINRSYAPLANSINADLFQHLQRRKYTDSNEVALANRIVLENSGYSKRIYMRSAREVDLTQLKERSVILMGSPIGNPWSQLYFEGLPFQFDNTQRGVVLNPKPGRNEKDRYVSTTRSGEIGDTHALIAFIPNLGASGYALLIAGTTAEGTAAAAEFVLDESKMSQAYKTLGINRTGQPSYFELLLKAKTLPGSSAQTTIQAWRLLGTSVRQVK